MKFSAKPESQSAAQLAEEMHYLVYVDVPEDVRCRAIYEMHQELSTDEYQSVWEFLNAPTRRKWKECVAIIEHNGGIDLE